MGFQGNPFTFFFQNHTLENIFQKFSKISPTCPKFNTHKKIVVHFFIPMLLLLLTPPSTYLKIKKIKGPKVDHSLITSSLITSSLHFTSRLTFVESYLVPRYRRLTFVE